MLAFVEGELLRDGLAFAYGLPSTRSCAVAMLKCSTLIETWDAVSLYDRCGRS